MNFDLTDDQKSLKDLAAQILADASSDDQLRDFAASGPPYDKALWGTLAEAGLLGLAIGEDQGGVGLGLVDLGLLLEEQGRTLARVPLTACLVLGAATIEADGSAAQKDAWLGRVARGEAILAAAIEEVGGIDRERPLLRAETEGNGWRLTGTKVAVSYGAQADALLVTAMTADGPAVFLIDPQVAGLTIEPQISTSGEPQAQLRFDAVAVDGGHLVGSLADGGRVVRNLIQRGQIALAARQVGVAGEALRRTALYSSERVQFGRPLGSMQAVQQRAADAFIDVEAMRSTALLAAWSFDQGRAQSADIAVAKYWAAMGGHRVVHTAQHLHGGMGADVTYPIHRFFLEAIQIGEALGGAAPMLAQIGRDIAAGHTAPLA